MAGSPLDKPTRIVDRKAVDAARACWCDVCGGYQGPFQVHHVRSRGAGGHDAGGNLLCCCWLCHHRIHTGEIPRARVLEILAERAAGQEQAGADQ